MAEVKPLLKWAGGKRRLLQTLFEVFPANLDLNRNNYFEPFVGGGAVLFGLANHLSAEEIGLLSKKQKSIIVSDTNEELINFYKVVRDSPGDLSNKIRDLAKKTDRDDFYSVRASSPKTKVGRAARLLYLNRLCFNGLYRVNSKGEFNVPWGKLQNPRIFDEAILLANSKRLSGAKIAKRDFLNQLELAKKGDLVYLDPPYIPLSSSSSFSKYSKLDFDLSNHEQLANCINSLTKRGVFVVLSNSDTSDTRRIFGESMNLYQISVGRSISAKSESRKRVNEIIATNYDVDSISDVGLLKKIK